MEENVLARSLLPTYPRELTQTPTPRLGGGACAAQEAGNGSSCLASEGGVGGPGFQAVAEGDKLPGSPGRFRSQAGV